MPPFRVNPILPRIEITPQMREVAEAAQAWVEEHEERSIPTLGEWLESHSGQASVIRAVSATIANPQMAELYRRYAEEELRRRERLALCGMIREAEGELLGTSPVETLVRARRHNMTSEDWRREMEAEWTQNPNHERGEDNEGRDEDHVPAGGDEVAGGPEDRVEHGRGGYRGQAADTFARLLLQGHVGFVTSGDKPRKLEEFDPEAGRIVVVMPMAGG